MTNQGDSGARRVPMLPAQVLTEIDAQLDAIAGAAPPSAGPLWGAMHKILLKAKVSPAAIMPLVAGRDLTGLRALVASLRGEAPTAVPEPSGPRHEPVDPDTLRHAMKAFRQRLKFTRLDAESRLGVGPMSGGRKHGIDAINPPRDFPLQVWEALADAGKLKRAGPGFYALAEETE